MSRKSGTNEREVAETQPSSAAEAPGGARQTLADMPGTRVVHSSPGVVGTSSDSSSGHELYCDCPDCRPDDFFLEVDEHDTCHLGFEQFVFTTTPEEVPLGDYQDCWHPDTYMAYWDHADLIVADTQSELRYRVVYYEAQRRPASRQYYTWYCERLGVTDPCTEEYLKDISS